MTLNELIKLADANQVQPIQPQPPQQPQPPKPVAAVPYNAQGQPAPQRNGYGYTRDTYKIPQQYAQHQNADGSLTKFNQQEYNDWQNNVNNWEAQRKADLEAQGIQLTDQNKHLWNHAAAWNYINQQRGAAQDTGRHWYKPWTWFQDAPTEFTQATNNWDPVEMEAAKARSQGYQTGTQQDVVLNRATNAKFLNNFVDKYINKAIGDQANKANAEFAQELRNMGVNPYEVPDVVAASNAEVLGQDIPYIGKGINIAGRLGSSFTHDLVDFYLFGKAAEGLGAVGNALGPAIGKFAPGAAAVAGKVTAPVSRFAQAHPRIAAAGSQLANVGPASAAIMFGEPIATGLVTREFPEIGMALGISPNREAENWERAVYGNDIYNNEVVKRPLVSADNPEQVLTFMDTEHGGDNPANYGVFRQWAEDTGNLDKMNDPAVQKQWIEQYTADGTAMHTVMLTPMYQNQSAEDKAQIATDMLMKRVKATQNIVGLAWDKYVRGRTGAEILSEAMRNDETGTLQNIMTDFLANNDAQTIVKFIENNMGDVTGKGTGVDTSNLYDTFREGLVANLAGNPNQIPGTMNALLKLQEAKSQDGNDLSGSQGANAVKMAFAEALADPDVVNDMSDDNLMKLAEMFAYNGNMADGMEALGDKGMELANAAEENIRGRIREAFFNNPFKNGPQIAGLWLASKGLGSIGQFASNPWVFYSVAMSLLLGGALLLTSGIDDDDDEEEDDYHRSLKASPWS